MSSRITINLTHVPKCSRCGLAQNIFICLMCQCVACDHLEYDHMFHHFVLTDHHLSLSLKDKYVYDLSLGIRVNVNVSMHNNVLQLVHNTGKTSTRSTSKIDPSRAQARSDITEFSKDLQLYEGLVHHIVEELRPTNTCLKKPIRQSQVAEERVQEINRSPDISEEKKLIHIHQLKKLNDLQLENEEFKLKIEILTTEKQEKEKVIHELRQDFNKETSRHQKLQKRLSNLERDYAQENLINKQLGQNQIDLKHDLEIKNTEIQELKDQMRDLMFHLDSEQKLKQSEIADELPTSKIVFGVSSNKGRRQKRK